MGNKRPNPEIIREFILENLEIHPEKAALRTAEKFKISRQAVNVHFKKLEEEGLLLSEGKTRNKKYLLKKILDKVFTIPVTEGLAEDKVWRQDIEPHFKGLKPNILQICQHGFTEIFNNVIDHSEAKQCVVSLEATAKRVKLSVSDDGVGIFEKIRKECHLEDHRHAILELAKGKLTTDPQKHTGEGIFFTTWMFDKFSILSGKLFFSHFGEDDWLIEDAKQEYKGTAVFMSIYRDSQRTVQGTFEKFASEADDFGFTKTHVLVSLAIYGDENLVSRSQAKRLLARFDRFKEVFLDFEGVSFIGHAFADEIFRVFKQSHPDVKITWIRANEAVEGVIHAKLKELSES